jgi:hypothetical protein
MTFEREIPSNFRREEQDAPGGTEYEGLTEERNCYFFDSTRALMFDKS